MVKLIIIIISPRFLEYLLLTLLSYRLTARGTAVTKRSILMLGFLKTIIPEDLIYITKGVVRPMINATNQGGPKVTTKGRL